MLSPHGLLGNAVALSTALLCCAPLAAATAADQRGFVIDGLAGGLLFQRCGPPAPAAPALMLLDKTPDSALLAGIGEVRKIMLEPDRPLYVEFRGEVAGSAVTARQFQRAVGHVTDCATALPVLPAELRLMAEGGLPAWRLQATAKGTRLEERGAKALQFSAVSTPAPSGGGKARNFTAKPAQSGHALQLELTEQVCSDGRSEAAYGARAVVRVGERRLEGCAARF